ncbi:protein-L-isoaspartate(D-aspartate) O-methyltransferase [Streptomyces eurocidicus]|uniref:Protein-L-isoaspartate O-methyltransferase n=1 Tax=Streptomyces eurocidicus TaxID=66423 RepID=A0A2N8NXT8_STREU|nr:methyltransferase domain-containing protein [Streptomyces eurocidicus]MBB5123055.1 protein-L-isoaspartate O-methyltransferase [Streptomyces eurocidicus]MBF6053847.1 methyltransferase domain-containing protein [Streptomyces eurocidicus]PNE33577.1 protein-L-isoaspartate(D-aspartate) O-methyltransferase [Streptomyces eurocidicus]
MNWAPRAAALAERVTHPSSRWRAPVAQTARHELVPRWWQRAPGGWALRNGEADKGRWLDAAYGDASLVTSVGPLHADHATGDDHPAGLPTSSSTLPGLVVRMFQHARLGDDDTVCDIGTGSGYGAALAARRLGDAQITSVDVDPYLVEAARARLDAMGLHPALVHTDATGDLPGTFDRIVATVGVRPIPASWLAALEPHGRLVTTIAGTSLLVTAEKTEDGGATGRVEWDRAGFMHTRHGSDYPPRLAVLLAAAREHDGDDISTGRYPVVQVTEAWDLASMLDVVAPGIEHRFDEGGTQRTALMAHADGSWARATARADEAPQVHQGGPRRLWDILDEIRTHWLTHGELPVRGAKVFVKPDGSTYLARGKWLAEL